MSDILTGAHALREKLVDVEIRKRAAMRAAYRMDPECDRLGGLATQASKAVRACVKELRELKGKRGHIAEKAKQADGEDKKRLRAKLKEEKPEVDAARDALEARLVELRRAEKEAIAEWAKRRKSAATENEAVKSALQAAQAQADVESKACAAESNVRSGTKDATRAACAQAFQKRPLFDFTWPNDPEHLEFDGRGRIAHSFTKQTAGGVPVSSLLDGTNPQVRIVRGYGRPKRKPDRVVKNGPNQGCTMGEVLRRNPEARRAPTSDKRAAARDFRVLRVRLGRDEWAAWPMVMNRPPPPTAKVLGIAVCSRRDGDRIRWHVTITVEDGLPSPSQAPKALAVVDVGWRVEDDGSIHVATIWEPTGERRRVVLSNVVHAQPQPGEPKAGVVASLAFANGLREAADELFDRQVAALKAWARSLGGNCPSWLSEAMSTSHAWRSHEHLHKLVEQWSTNRFDEDTSDVPELRAWMDEGDLERYGKTDAFATLRAWQRKDMHLWRWERDERRAALGERQWIYRNVAANLAREYRTVVFAKDDLSKVAKKRKKDDSIKGHEATRAARFVASVSELRGAIEKAMVREGGRVAYVPLTAAERKAAASGDDVARCAAILAAFADTARKDEIKWLFAQKKESHWAKVRRVKAEKEAAKQGAREAVGKAAE